MKKLVSNARFLLAGREYLADVYLTLYTSGPVPALVLLGSNESEHPGEPIAKATVCPPTGYLTGQPSGCIVFKTWAENAGLMHQILELRGPREENLFTPCYTRDGSAKLAFSLGFCIAPVYRLAGSALMLFDSLVLEREAERRANQAAGLDQP